MFNTGWEMTFLGLYSLRKSVINIPDCKSVENKFISPNGQFIDLLRFVLSCVTCQKTIMVKRNSPEKSVLKNIEN